MCNAFVSMLAAALCLAPAAGRAGDAPQPAKGAGIAIVDFDYADTSGEARDQSAEHAARLSALVAGLKRDFGARTRLHVVEPTCRPAPCALSGTTTPDLLAAARAAGADMLLIGGVHKMSTLVQWAKIQAFDVKTGRLLFEKLFTFRGDTDDAWRRAEAFIFDEIAAIPGS